jgi:rod shape-determining protein MreC
MMLRLIAGYRRLLVLLFVTVLVVFLLFPQLQKQPVYYMGRPLVIVMSAIQQGVTSLMGAARGVWEGYLDLVGVREENDRLRAEIDRLEQKNAGLLEARLENDRLRGMLALRLDAGYDVVAARVIGRDPSNWYRTVMIDKGEQDGVAVDMGVVVPAGVVGRVIKIGRDFAQVLLLTDRNSAVAAVVQRTRDEGIVEGAEGGLAQMRYIPLLSEAGPKDAVLTSGLGGGFPKGLVIGEIRSIVRREAVLFQEAQLVPAVDFSKLEEVLVITRIVHAPAGP